MAPTQSEDVAMARTVICCHLNRPDAIIDEIVAACSDDDIVSAVKTLLLVNEQLESELQQLYAAAAYRSPTKRQVKRSLH
jgi:hypothetical protein